MKLQLAKTTDQNEVIVIVLKEGKKGMFDQHLFVKPLADLDTRDETAIDNGSIQMALWTMTKDELQIIKGATFDTSVLPKLQQDKFGDFLNEA